MSDKPKRIPRFGPEIWEERVGWEWSLWDLWFSTVAVVDHAGSLESLEALLVESIRESQSGRNAGEAKLSHVWDLASRLDDAGLTVSDLADDDMIRDKAVVRRARDKVSGKVSLDHRAKTPAMLDKPRTRLRHHARFGHWASFTGDPARFYVKFRPIVERVDHITKGKSFAAVGRLTKRLRELDGPRRSVTERLAKHRARSVDLLA